MSAGHVRDVQEEKGLVELLLLLTLETMAPIDVVPQPTTSPRPPETPPSSPVLSPCEQVLTMKDAQQFLKLLKNIQANQTPPVPQEANQQSSIKDSSNDKQQGPARASKLEFKTVNEM
ncbi:MAG: hypothetical protein Q9217_002279 [Psora testacea]